MDSTPKILAFAGSAREGSLNKLLVRAAAAAARALGAEVTLVDLRDYPMPIYDGDVEGADGQPENAEKLKALFAASDGLLIASPEYNSSLPAVTKNVIDWLSRDPSAWDGTGITMVAMSPGGRAALGAREHFEAIMPRQASRLFPTLGLGNYGDRVDDAGEVSDAAAADSIRWQETLEPSRWTNGS